MVHFMEKHMFSNTSPSFIKVALLSASFLTIQNAVGMDGDAGKNIGNRAFNLDAKEWEPGQDPMTSEMHRNDAVAESPLSSYIYQASSSVGGCYPYSTQGDMSVQSGFYYGQRTYPAPQQWTSENTSYSARSIDSSIFPLSSRASAYYPFYGSQDTSLPLAGLLSGASLATDQVYSESKHSLVLATYPKISFFDQDVATMKRMIQNYLYYGSFQHADQVICYKNALALAMLLNDKEIMAQAYIALGNTGDGKDRGLTHYKAALDLLGEHGDKTVRAQIYRCMADVL